MTKKRQREKKTILKQKITFWDKKRRFKDDWFIWSWKITLKSLEKSWKSVQTLLIDVDICWPKKGKNTLVPNVHSVLCLFVHPCLILQAAGGDPALYPHCGSVRGTELRQTHSQILESPPQQVLRAAGQGLNMTLSRSRDMPRMKQV